MVDKTLLIKVYLTMAVRTDIECLTECLRYHHDDAERAKDTLVTLASLCSGSAEAQNLLRSSGGLSFIVNLMSTTQNNDIKIATLYALGCATERNVFTQTRLCTEAMFKFLYSWLTNVNSTVQLKRTTAFFIMCLVTNNGKGQMLARKTSCLDALLQLFRRFPDIDLPYSPDRMSSSEGDKQLLSQLWKDVTSTLCGCVNNPINDENQLVCASSLPAALYIMAHTKDTQVTHLLCTFVSLLTASNGINQDRLHMLGGLEVIVGILISVVEDLMTDPQQEKISAASVLISMLSSATAENERNLAAAAKLKVVPQLLKLLNMDVIDSDFELKIIITLGCLVAANEESQKQVVENNGLKILLSNVMTGESEEGVKAATLVLNSCVNAVSMPGGNPVSDTEEDLDSAGQEEKPAEGPPAPVTHNDHNDRDSSRILKAQIGELQKQLQEERKLRKGLEDEKASLQVSDRDRSGRATCVNGRIDDVDNKSPNSSPYSPAHTTPAEQDEGSLSGESTSAHSSRGLMQLRERVHALEEKLQNIHNAVPSSRKRDGAIAIVKEGSQSLAETSPSSSSDLESSGGDKPAEISLGRKGLNEDTRGTVTPDDMDTSGNNSIRKPNSIENNKSKPSQFKEPQRPFKRCKPFRHGNAVISKDAANAKKNTQKESIGIPSVHAIGRVKENRGKRIISLPKLPPVTSCSKPQEVISKTMFRGQSAGCHVERPLAAVGKQYGAEENQSLMMKHSPSKEWKDEQESMSGNDFSDAVSIADSVISSLGIHLARPIRPIQCLPIERSVHQQQPTPSGRGVLQAKRKPQTEEGRFDAYKAKSQKIVGSNKQPDVTSSKHAHLKNLQNGPQTSTDQSTDYIVLHAKHVSRDMVAKLRATPKVHLKKALRNKNMQMFTFTGDDVSIHSSKHKNQKKDVTTQTVPKSKGEDKESRRACQMPQPIQGTKAGSQKKDGRTFFRGSASSRKCYSVRYIRGKIQCSNLYQRTAQNCATSNKSPKDSRLGAKCSGCCPPGKLPLLDSHSLMPSLIKSKGSLCQTHRKLVSAVRAYCSRMGSRLGK